MAGKEPTAGQPYRAGDTTPTPWAEARERLADADTYWLAGAKQLPYRARPGPSSRRCGDESGAGRKRTRKEKVSGPATR